MTLFDRYLDFIERHRLYKHSDKVLIACSGGIDSMVLVDLMLRQKVSIGLAYFDHVTREGASHSDGLFVHDFAMKNNIPFFKKKFNIQKALKEGTTVSNNFQETARILRYEFFKSLLQEHPYNFIATGHHQHDRLESFIFNLSRSSGPEGLEGISLKRDKIIRPLLCFTKNQIQQYADKYSIEHIVDLSNNDLGYRRNSIRHTIIPNLEAYDDHFIESASKSMDYIQEQNSFIKHEIDRWKKQYVRSEPPLLYIPLETLRKHHSPKLLLFHILRPYLFNRAQIETILGVSQKGKVIISSKATCYLEDTYLIMEDHDYRSIPHKEYSLHISNTKPDQKHLKIAPSIGLEQLEIRHWHPGDYMQFSYGRKKLKKLFNELKVSNIEKKKVLLIAKKSEILWIIGLKKSEYLNEDAHYLSITEIN